MRLHNTSFIFKTAISFNLADHCSWRGAPIGKEAAPREIGTLFAGPIGNICILSIKDRIFLLACGAGAGLAAVYQVPLTSVFFVLKP